MCVQLQRCAALAHCLERRAENALDIFMKVMRRDDGSLGCSCTVYMHEWLRNYLGKAEASFIAIGSFGLVLGIGGDRANANLVVKISNDEGKTGKREIIYNKVLLIRFFGCHSGTTCDDSAHASQTLTHLEFSRRRRDLIFEVFRTTLEGFPRGGNSERECSD